MDDYIQPKCSSIPIEFENMNDEIKKNFSGIFKLFDPISLTEMDAVHLMNRVDTKFLINIHQLPELLQKAAEHYRIVEVDGERISPYSSIYFDTADAEMYNMHHNGKLNRYKIRMRSYVNSGDSFFEIKLKNNKGRTSKKRFKIKAEQFRSMLLTEKEQHFVQDKTPYEAAVLKPQIQNFFERITLVDKNETERVTLDLGLVFLNLSSGAVKSVDELVIVEMKQDGLTKSFFRSYLNDLHVLPGSMSKYCLGMVLVNSTVKSNRFKRKLRKINKITDKNHVTI